MRHGEYRVPWWAVFVPRSVDDLVAHLPRLFAQVSDPPDREDIEPAHGAGWSGLISYRREEPNWALADAARSEYGPEVKVAEWGHAPGVWIWDSSVERWTRSDETTSALAKRLGVVWPWPDPPTRRRAERYAALLIGASLADVRREASDERNVIETPRGPAVLGDESAAWAFAETPGVTTYAVTHFLDSGEFWVSVYTGGDAWMFGGSIEGVKRLSDIEGEVEPRSIVRKLGLPEHYIFPDSTN